MPSTFVPPEDSRLAAGVRELAGKLLAGTTPQHLAGEVASLAARSLPGCDAASITVVREGTPSTAGCSDEVARDVDEAQYEAGEGPCLAAIERAALVRVDVMVDELRWPHFTAEAGGRGIHSSLSVPLAVGHRVVGGLNLYSRQPWGFDGCEPSAAFFATQAAVTWSNHGAVHRAEAVARALKAAIERRDVIGRAKGMLGASRGLTSDQAFDVLRRTSQETGRKLYDVARELVERQRGFPRTAT